MKKEINPPIGGYFKHNNLIYCAFEPEDKGTCKGCDFVSKKGKCTKPVQLNCNGKILKDVTGKIEVDLIDEPEKNGCFPTSVGLVIASFIVWYVFIKIIIIVIKNFS